MWIVNESIHFGFGTCVDIRIGKLGKAVDFCCALDPSLSLLMRP